MRRLRDDEILRTIFTNYDTEKHQLPSPALACTGAKVFDDGPAQGGAASSSWPFTLKDDDFVYGNAADRVKIVWVPMTKYPDGTEGGPLALIRGNEKFAELFGVAGFRGRRERLKLGSERMGADLLVTIDDDACGGKKDVECETKQSIFRARNGQLQHITDVSVNRVGYVGSTEKGAPGTLEYRLTSVATFREDGLHIVEQIRAKDEVGREIRKVELERLLTIDDLGNVKASEPPLWERVVQGPPRTKAPGATPGDDKHSAPKEQRPAHKSH